MCIHVHAGWSMCREDSLCPERMVHVLIQWYMYREDAMYGEDIHI